MSYYYGGPDPFVVIAGIIAAVILVTIILVVFLVPGEDPVLSEQLNKYEIDPTIVAIGEANCVINRDELKACTVSFEAPLELVTKAQYIRLIDPEADVAAVETEEGEPEEESED